MSGRHRVHVVDLAIRPATIEIGSAIPAGDTGFYEDGFRVGGNFWIPIFAGRLRGGRISGWFFLRKRRRRWNLSLRVLVAASGQSEAAEKNKGQYTTQLE